MIQFQLLAGFIFIGLIFMALFGCKGIIPIIKEHKNKKKKFTIIE